MIDVIRGAYSGGRPPAARGRSGVIAVGQPATSSSPTRIPRRHRCPRREPARRCGAGRPGRGRSGCGGLETAAYSLEWAGAEPLQRRQPRLSTPSRPPWQRRPGQPPATRPAAVRRARPRAADRVRADQQPADDGTGDAPGAAGPARMRVLDVGSRSGWTTVLLARLVGETGLVIGVERIPSWSPTARRRSGRRGCPGRRCARPPRACSASRRRRRSTGSSCPRRPTTCRASSSRTTGRRRRWWSCRWTGSCSADARGREDDLGYYVFVPLVVDDDPPWG